MLKGEVQYISFGTSKTNSERKDKWDYHTVYTEINTILRTQKQNSRNMMSRQQTQTFQGNFKYLILSVEENWKIIIIIKKKLSILSDNLNATCVRIG